MLTLRLMLINHAAPITLLLHWISGASFILFGAATLTASDKSQFTQCPGLKEETKNEIIRLVRFRYKMNPEVALQVEEEKSSKCYFHVQVRSTDPEQGFSKLFTITPDQMYVASDLIDLSEDPEKAARRVHDEFVQHLIPKNAFVRGDRQAPVNIVIFSDFQCPFCKRAAELLETEMTSNEHQLKLVFRQFPLPMHDWATQAAEASVCAGQQQQDLFWATHDFLFRHQRELSRSNIKEALEKELESRPEFNLEQFQQCISTGTARASVQADVRFGLENRVDSTPTVFINGVRANWAGNADQLRSLIRQASRTTYTLELDSDHKESGSVEY